MCFEAAYALIVKLKDKINGSGDKDKEAVRLLASLMLCLQHVLKHSLQAEAVDSTSSIDNYRTNLHKLMKEWITNFNVIGGSLFGGGSFKRTELELKVMGGCDMCIMYCSEFYLPYSVFRYGSICLHCNLENQEKGITVCYCYRLMLKKNGII